MLIYLPRIVVEYHRRNLKAKKVAEKEAEVPVKAKKSD
jgi:hypothetical protein